MNCRELKELDLSRNRLDPRSVGLLCSRLANQKAITKLVLQWCDLTDLMSYREVSDEIITP
jgi:hypothetical protein